MKNLILFAFLALLTVSCGPKTSSAPPTVSERLSPDSLYGPLFKAVQLTGVFPDSKTFPDCTPKMAPQTIVQEYRQQLLQPGFDLKAFVLSHFDLPVTHGSQFTSDTSQSPEAHIEALWPVLTRPADTPSRSSLLPLPNPYVVPGGRFGEMYYWDSYFTMLGLKASGRMELLHGMVDNFAYLIDTYGHIPNGTRTYYLSRSQPPFFSLMVALLDEADTTGAVYAPYLPQLEKEYAFWMQGADNLSESRPQHRRVVRLPDGAVLNRYWDDSATPRPEAYKEDLHTAEQSGRPIAEVFRDLRAAAESGWDFSSRWFNGADLTTIQTTQLLPVDLNCLLYHLEYALAQGFQYQKKAQQAAFYQNKAQIRAQSVQQLFFDPKTGWFFDYIWKENRLNDQLTLAGAYPLFFGIASPQQIPACAKTLETKLLKPGGFATTLKNTGQQWDAPNGWPPLQWMAIHGLQRAGQDQLARKAAERWRQLCTGVYKRTGKMLEKYNVDNLQLEGGGGEYPVQDGFGWTNGIYLQLLKNR